MNGQKLEKIENLPKSQTTGCLTEAGKRAATRTVEECFHLASGGRSWVLRKTGISLVSHSNFYQTVFRNQRNATISVVFSIAFKGSLAWLLIVF